MDGNGTIANGPAKTPMKLAKRTPKTVKKLSLLWPWEMGDGLAVEDEVISSPSSSNSTGISVAIVAVGLQFAGP
jgi:hypothetical protein